MPLYKFQCYECGYSFEKICKKSTKVFECNECNALAQRKDEAPTVAFKADTEGMGPQNTGISAWDHDYDRAIAEDSFKKWRIIKERYLIKKELLSNNPGSKGEQIQRTPDGEYILLDEDKAKYLMETSKEMSKPFQEEHKKKLQELKKVQEERARNKNVKK